MSKKSPIDLLTAALQYAAVGLSVVPVHSINGDGWCSCGDGKSCASPGNPHLVYLSCKDLHRYWLDLENRPPPKQTGKQPRIKAHLAEMFPNGVPDPAHCPRKALKADLLKRDPSLNPLDEATLKSAIDAYNSSQADPKQS
jgi:hypothetical protein